MLNQLDNNNISEIAAVHRLAFPESAWTKLGGKVVEEYYLWHLVGPHPVVRATGAFVDGCLVGFCVSGVFNASTSGFLSKSRNLLMMRLVKKPWLVFDPIFFGKIKSGIKILNRYRRKSQMSAKQPPPPAADSFGILAIAVDPRRQGLGLGQLLMDDAEKTAVELNFSKMDLTVNPNNFGAIKFYERLNWVKLVKNESWKGVMIKTLNPPVRSNSQRLTVSTNAKEAEST